MPAHTVAVVLRFRGSPIGVSLVTDGRSNMVNTVSLTQHES